jgi:hypothetical protein
MTPIKKYKDDPLGFFFFGEEGLLLFFDEKECEFWFSWFES